MSNNYLIPQIERESAAGVQQVSLVTDAFSNRRLFLFGEINEALVYSFTMQMLYLMVDTQSEINIYIDSPGGEVNSGLAIYDLIQYCKAPINMYCVGLAASMGAIVFAGGQKGRRFMLPHSKVMIHEPMIAGGLEGSASTIRSTAIKILQMRQLLNSILAKHSGKTTQEIDRATEHDNFMSAEEAIAFGLCDAVADRI